jgi:FMN-dependent NADH-azoreductase
MKNILHIDCSPRPESHSRQLSGAIVKKILEVAPGASISRRDFAAVPLPHAAPDYATTLSSPATLAAPLKGSLDLSEMLIQEVEAADVIVIGTPMHNLTVPSVLKAWIDQILRAGRTFKSTPAGKVGMLRDRPVFIGIASGGVDGRFPVRHLLCRDGAAALLVELLFAALGLIPQQRNALVVEATTAWNYTTWLNIAFLAVVPYLV